MPPTTTTAQSLDASQSLEEILEKFNVSKECGFLLPNPLTKLPEYFDPWQELCEEFQELVARDATLIRGRILALPLLDASLLSSHPELRLAHLLLVTLASAYLWADRTIKPPSVLPRVISLPLHEVSTRLGMAPAASLASTILANWQWKEKTVEDQPLVADNMDIVAFRFLQTPGNVWFFTMTAHIEVEMAPCITAIADVCHKGARATDADIEDAMKKIISCLATISKSIMRMSEHLQPSEFFHNLRPFLLGYSMVEGGVTFEGLEHLGPHTTAGVTAAQSSTLPTVDAFVGVPHKGNDKSFLIDQRLSMPRGHREFLEWIEERVTSDSSSLLGRIRASPLLDDVAAGLKHFRSAHIRIAALFITTQIKKDPGAAGTGGKPFMEFLKNVRADVDEIKEH